LTPASDSTPGKWPKTFPPLTAEQERIRDDFMHYWHEVLPKKYAVIDRFSHRYPVDNAPADFHRTLEIGAGLGEHLEYERLTPAQRQGYVALELRPNMAAEIVRRFPGVEARVGDCQQRLEFDDDTFDRVIAVHVLEHLPNLPAAVREVHRLCHKTRGRLHIVIPCEGGLAYGLSRRISAQRIFERRYHQPYQWFIEREHMNRPSEILEVLAPHFTVEHRSFFPLVVPVVTINLCIGLTLKPR
jgi:SAM-dependent methyltransferase